MSKPFRRRHDSADLEIEVDGARIPARSGESAAAAMLAAGIAAFGTDPKGAARGPACMMGACFQCACTIDDVPDMRACRVSVTPGMRISTAPARAPIRSTPSPIELDADVAVVGAGPAGGACALALAAEGLRVTLIDDTAAAGGQIWRKRFDVEQGGGAWLRSRLVAAKDRIDHRAGYEVLGRGADGVLMLADRDGCGAVSRARHLVIASGALEVPNPAPGWTLPGVVNLGALQILAKADGVVPDGPVLLAGAGPLLYVVAHDLVVSGVRPVAVIDAAPWPSIDVMKALWAAPGLFSQALKYEWKLRSARVPILRSSRIERIERNGDMLRVVATGGRRFDVAVVGTSLGLRPNIELAAQAGVSLAHDPQLGGWHAQIDAQGATSRDGIYAIGETRGIGGAEAALCDGVITAAAIVEAEGRIPSTELARAASAARERRAKFMHAARVLGNWARVEMPAGDAASIVCRCEAVTRGEISRATAMGLSGPREAKLATRAGMGFCQGRTCHPAVQAAIGADEPPSYRFPLRPVRADAFGAHR
ncbi:MAG: FAD-dependent oxidoreductase [Alphaproteobacteria bacterium]|nr:FAD-dependent oxidoreductase [Alphaproteobacteria bacterium]